MPDRREKLLALLGVVAAGALLALSGFFAWALQAAMRGEPWIGF